MARVFVTQQPRRNSQGWQPNLSPAAQFGAIHYVFEAGEQPFSNTGWAMVHAAKVLRDFNPEEDYVLWPNTGDPAAAWAVMIVLALRGLSKIKTLYWERKLVGNRRDTRSGFYSPVVYHLLKGAQ